MSLKRFLGDWITFSVLLPLVLISSLSAKPYFKSNSKAFAQRMNGTVVFANLVALALLDAWLLVNNQDASALPGGLIILLVIFATWIVVLSIFTGPVVEELVGKWRRTSIAEKALAAGTGALVYVAILAKLGV